MRNLFRRKLSNYELLRKAAQGDEQAAMAFWKEHYSKVYGILLGILKNEDDALDLMQDTFIKAFEKADTLTNAEAVTAWLCQIARNNALSKLRKRKTEPVLSLDGQAGGDNVLWRSSENEDESTLYKNEQSDLMLLALAFLPDKEFQVFKLSKLNHKPLKEIAHELNTTVSYTENIASRSKKRLRTICTEALKKEIGFEPTSVHIHHLFNALELSPEQHEGEKLLPAIIKLLKPKEANHFIQWLIEGQYNQMIFQDIKPTITLMVERRREALACLYQ